MAPSYGTPGAFLSVIFGGAVSRLTAGIHGTAYGKSYRRLTLGRLPVSIHGLTAANVVGLSRDGTRLRFREETHQPRHFLGLNDPLDRHGLDRALLEFVERDSRRLGTKRHPLPRHVAPPPTPALFTRTST